MLGKSAWVSPIYMLALALLVLCGVLGVIMIGKATRPYYSMMDIPEKVREGKLDHYRTSEVDSHIFELIRKAAGEISREEFDLAEQHINKASKLDPGNAIFPYMTAGLYFRSNDFTRMWTQLKTGNDMGKVRLYASQYVVPEAWTHPEVPILRHMTTVMCKGMSTQQELWELVRMGNALAHCEPADVDTFAAGLSIREIAARRITELAKPVGDDRVVRKCHTLVQEKREAYEGYEEVLASASLRKVSIPTLLMAMASYRRNPHVRESFMINAYERQSEAVTDLRNRVLRTPVGSTL